MKLYLALIFGIVLWPTFLEAKPPEEKDPVVVTSENLVVENVIEKLGSMGLTRRNATNLLEIALVNELPKIVSSRKWPNRRMKYFGYGETIVKETLEGCVKAMLDKSKTKR